jgi:hypothetical protein
MNENQTNILLDAALSYLDAGLSIIPTGKDKRPTVSEWTSFQKALPSADQVKEWFSNGTRNIAVIGGAVSGNLEILDFDNDMEALPEWERIVNEEAPGLLSRVYFETSPHGGHVVYRCDSETVIPGNSKLAEKLIEVEGPGEHPHPYKSDQKLKAYQHGGKWIISPDLIETRGAGGYCLVAPSKGYTRKNGHLYDLPVIGREERDILIDTARSLNEVLPEVKHPTPARQQSPNQDQGRNAKLPGEDFDDRGDIRALLQKYKWTFKGHTTDGREKWARPGKERGKAGSATLTDGKIFYPFSSNAQPFESHRAYGPFGVYAILEHGGDFSAASKALSAQGYGARAQRPQQQKRRFTFMTAAALSDEFGKEVGFLWRDYIPKAAPCMFAGREKNGKSTTVAQISKEVVLQDPDALVLWIACEGFVSDHADKWVKLRMPGRVGMLKDETGNSYKLRLDSWRDLEFVDESLAGIKADTQHKIAMVVIDSVRGMQGVGENDPKMAQIMSSISAIICDKHQAACVFIAHHKKGKAESNVDKVAGGTGITSSVRAVYTVTRTGKFTCKITPDASNALGHNAMSYKSVLVGDEEEGFEIVISPIEDEAADTVVVEAEKFLVDIFKAQSKYKATTIYQKGAEQGLNKRAIQRAKEKFAIRVFHEKVPGPWFWECSL